LTEPAKVRRISEANAGLLYRRLPVHRRDIDRRQVGLVCQEAEPSLYPLDLLANPLSSFSTVRMSESWPPMLQKLQETRLFRLLIAQAGLDIIELFGTSSDEILVLTTSPIPCRLLTNVSNCATGRGPSTSPCAVCSPRPRARNPRRIRCSA
jgi:hypothetical protein